MLHDADQNNTPLKDLELIQAATKAKAARDFSQVAIHNDLVNWISLKFLAAPSSGQDTIAWLEHNYHRAVEACFSELHSHSYHHAKKLLNNHEKAEDIAQECIRELLKSNIEINNLKAWLARVAHNKAAALYQNKNRDDKIRNGLANICETPQDPDEDDLCAKFTPEKVKELLSKTDYQLYKRLSAAKNLKAYALERGISYQTAKEHRHRLKVNLRSAYLKEQGWRDSQEILSYQQLRSIKSFIGKITGTCGNISKYKDVREAFAGCTGIMTWEISMLDKNAFHVIVMVSTNELPTTVMMDIKLNRANRISITKFKKATLIATMPSGDTPVLRTEKGKGKLDYAELLSLVPKATVYDKVIFEEILQELKDR